MSIEQWSDLMFPEAEGKDAHLWGSVKAVNSDGSYEVQLNTSSVTTRCAAGCTAGVGDRVLVCIMANGRCVAVSRLEGAQAVFAKLATFASGAKFEGNVQLLKSIILANAQAVYGLNTEGAWRNLLMLTSANDLSVGYSGYSVGEGRTLLYGNNINLYWKGNLGGDHYKQLWSGTLSAGGTVTIENIAKYRMIGVVLTGQYTMMLGARQHLTGNWLRCIGSYDNGSTRRVMLADMEIDGTTISPRGACMVVLSTGGVTITEATIASIWGFF